jgi:hypothetical protein
MAPGCRIGLKNGTFDIINGYEEIKRHPYFADFDFKSLAERQLKVPFDVMSTSMTSMTDSDDGSQTKGKKEELKKSDGLGARNEDISLDPCCIQRALTLSRKYWEGEVKVRRKFILLRSRFLMLFENGTVLVLRKGHIKAEYLIDENSTITLSKKKNSFTLKTTYKAADTFETPDAETWVSILQSL